MFPHNFFFLNLKFLKDLYFIVKKIIKYKQKTFFKKYKNKKKCINKCKNQTKLHIITTLEFLKLIKPQAK